MRLLLLLLAAPAALGFGITRTGISDKPTIDPVEPPPIPSFDPLDIFDDSIIGDCGFNPVFPPCPMIGCPDEPCPEGQICRFINKVLQCTGTTPCTGCVDFCIILDTSGSIGPENFGKLIDFLKMIVGAVPVPPSQFGAVTFDRAERFEFSLSEHSNPSDIYDALDDIEFEYNNPYDPGATTCIGCGLNLCADAVFNQPDDRADCPNVALLLTDGKNNVGGSSTVTNAAQNLREGASNARLVTLGIGDVDQGRLTSISDDFFFSQNFENLQDLVLGILESACEGEGEGPK